MSGAAKIINDLDVIISMLSPGIDGIKLKIRLEEVIDQYNIEIKTNEELKADLTDNIKLYIASKRLEGLSDVTLKDYYGELMMFDFRVNKPTVQITTADIRRYLAENDDVMASTNSKKLSVIKAFFTWMVDEEILLRNPTARIKQIKQPKRLPKALTAIELEMLRDVCVTFRERSLVEVLYSTGCRLSEIANMRRKDIDWPTGSIRVIGKGDKERIVYLNPKAIFHLKAYLEDCEEYDNDCEFLFTTDKRPHRQMGTRTIQDTVDRITKRSNVDKRVTPHVFRHTMATLAMENGIELGDLQQLLGHSNPGTTLRYAAVSEERKHNAHKRFVR